MAEHKQVVDGRGRVWIVSRVQWHETEEEDFRFWYDLLSPEERVDAVADALESCLKTRGLDAIPRLRRVHRRIECPWRKEAAGRPQDRADVRVLQRAKGQAQRTKRPSGRSSRSRR
jgi:hypothetical protein